MSHNRGLTMVLVLVVLGAVCMTHAEDTKSPAQSSKIPKGAKVFVAPIADGFDTYLKDAIAAKKVPVEVVGNREVAEFEITGISETQKASTAKKVLFGNWHSREEASIQVSNLKSSEVIWSYSVHKEASGHGKKSTAEACAKHLKDEAIEK
ncbi:MAG TPA: hypothetical protein VJX16_06020 [Terriglobales bacterium]|nr:hypothetical protein [Terriglobales bacterium]